MRPFAVVFFRRRTLSSVGLCAVMRVGQRGIVETSLQQHVVEMFSQVVNRETVERVRRAPRLLECWPSGFACEHFVASSGMNLPCMCPNDIFALIHVWRST
jgi:hypothetical protein